MFSCLLSEGAIKQNFTKTPDSNLMHVKLTQGFYIWTELQCSFGSIFFYMQIKSQKNHSILNLEETSGMMCSDLCIFQMKQLKSREMKWLSQGFRASAVRGGTRTCCLPPVHSFVLNRAGCDQLVFPEDTEAMLHPRL